MGGDVEIDVAGALRAFPTCAASMGWGVAGGDGAHIGWLGLAGLTPASYACVQRGRGRKGRAPMSSSPRGEARRRARRGQSAAQRVIDGGKLKNGGGELRH